MKKSERYCGNCSKNINCRIRNTTSYPCVHWKAIKKIQKTCDNCSRAIEGCSAASNPIFDPCMSWKLRVERMSRCVNYSKQKTCDIYTPDGIVTTCGSHKPTEKKDWCGLCAKGTNCKDRRYSINHLVRLAYAKPPCFEKKKKCRKCTRKYCAGRKAPLATECTYIEGFSEKKEKDVYINLVQTVKGSIFSYAFTNKLKAATALYESNATVLVRGKKITIPYGEKIPKPSDECDHDMGSYGSKYLICEKCEKIIRKDK